MRNPEVAHLLYEIADLLEMQDVEWKPRSYRRAARNVEALSEPIEDLHERGELTEIDGVGDAIGDKIAEYLDTGRLEYHEQLKAEVPVDVEALTRVEGVGPKTVKRLYDALGIQDLDDLEAAAKQGRIADVEGFGETTQQNILDHIDLARRGQERTLFGAAVPVVQDLLERLEATGAFEELMPVGSYRRRMPTIGDVDVLATAEDPEAAAEAFVGLDDVAEVIAEGETRSSVRLRSDLQVDLRVVDPDAWGAALMYFTGSKDHNIAMRGRARDRDWKLNEYGLFDGDELIAAATEREVFDALEMDWVPPELREDTGEVQAAADGDLPDLVDVDDVRGDLQMHTTWSDGQTSVAAMAEQADDLGYDYILVTDHGPSLGVAGPPSLDEIPDYLEAIDEADEDSPVRVLKGLEANILADGLDIPLEVCKELDLVVAALHDIVANATDRVVQAIEDYPVDVLAHPTNRRMGEREGNELDIDRVIDAAQAHDVAIEINSQPDRLDLDWRIARDVADEVPFVISTDAHAPDQMTWMELGVAQARKAWLTPEHVVNTWPLDEVIDRLR